MTLSLCCTLWCSAAVDWYLHRVQQAVEEAKRATDGAPMTLLAHSAGGWLGRWAGEGSCGITPSSGV